MNILSKLIDKLYLKQWSVGIINESIQDVIRNKKVSKKITWIHINNNFQFFADPFIFKSESGNYSILYEELDYHKQYGYICQFDLDKKNNVVSKKIILDTKSHLSYPFIFYEDGSIYVFPEASKSGKLTGYQFNKNEKTLSYKGDLINIPAVDSTILKYKNKYWIFCGMDGVDANKKLYIFHSENLWGPYKEHKENPVKETINGCRPAGNFIEVEGNLYRPAQNSGKYYGSSISIYKIIHLCEDKFIEEPYMSIHPAKTDYYNFGMHTINSIDKKIVVDGLVRRFLPLTQVRTFIRNKLLKKNNLYENAF
ncbi:MAG: hypothetical protein ABI261_01025 [Ginsengibacter sp.]